MGSEDREADRRPVKDESRPGSRSRPGANEPTYQFAFANSFMKALTASHASIGQEL